ncbi:hypothetical protein Pmani_036375 [Petrolisthes manimaculis]|uniref:Uncharacterized protein n=1 Tax=Petrolisthes manimaculis TaxID=1843537 RepID=A0AAE1TMR4_9EUCA|nr:hypothetical protein Pmani_036375 [Petrolisthes manimaculis]
MEVEVEVVVVVGSSAAGKAGKGKGQNRQRGDLRRGSQVGWERRQRHQSSSAGQPPISVSPRKYTPTHTLPLSDALCSSPRCCSVSCVVSRWLRRQQGVVFQV